MTKFISWNVNGIRACIKKGFLEWLHKEQPDFLMLQEAKALPEQLSDNILKPTGYHTYWNPAEKKGYSGVAALVKEPPISVDILGIEEFDREGRVQILQYPLFAIVNCYFPNSQEKGKRIAYKIQFCEAILKKCNQIQAEGKDVILCGDYNVAHTEIDLKNPKTNHQNPGFLPKERQWMTRFLKAGYCDIFRDQHPNEPEHYSWWSYRFQAREKDIGWRIDYFCMNQSFSKKVKQATILKEIMGSDHCPISLELND